MLNAMLYYLQLQSSLSLSTCIVPTYLGYLNYTLTNNMNTTPRHRCNPSLHDMPNMSTYMRDNTDKRKKMPRTYVRYVCFTEQQNTFIIQKKEC